jgi:multidrug transporter EmrE-like cation transporter
MHYAFLAVAIAFEVIATLMLKQSDGWTKWKWGMGSLVCYWFAGALLAICLKSMSVGLVYAIWAGLGIGLVCIASVLIWHQRLDAAAIAGIACIGVGVLLITLKSGVMLQ